MTDLALLRTFLAIYRTGSLTRAARQMGLTQPAISQQLKALEAQLAGPLFTRTAQGVSPTPAAEELAADVAAHVDALEVAVERRRPGLQGTEGIVHLGARADFLAAFVLPALADAWRAGIRIICHPTVGTASREGVRRGELDVAFTDALLAEADLTFERLADYDFALVASPRRGAELHAMSAAARRNALACGPFVAYTEEMPRVRAILEASFDVVIRDPPAVVVPDLRAAGEAVAAGSAFALLERPLAKGMLARGAVVEVAPLRPTRRAPLQMVVRRGMITSPRIRAITSTLRSAAKDWC